MALEPEMATLVPIGDGKKGPSSIIERRGVRFTGP
jgi:hypothetical protein